MKKTTAYILLSHGSRGAEGAGEIEALARLVAERRGGDAVAPAYFQFDEPNLAEAVRAFVEQGAERVVIVPIFIALGAHVGRDIPRLVEEIRRRHPAVEIRLARHLGADPLLADLVLIRVAEALK